MVLFHDSTSTVQQTVYHTVVISILATVVHTLIVEHDTVGVDYHTVVLYDRVGHFPHRILLRSLTTVWPNPVIMEI